MATLSVRDQTTAAVAGAPNDRLAVGLRVAIDFDDASPGVTLPRFRAADR